MFEVRIQSEAFDGAEESRRLRAGRSDVGALVLFEGICRDHAAGSGGQPAASVQSLELEHYPEMTRASIEGMVDQARARWPLLGAVVVHRVGLLHPGDPIVLVVVASSHRHDAFEACAFLMDYLKTQAPLWKKEATPQGAQWVDARDSDDAALARWGVAANNASGPRGA